MPTKLLGEKSSNLFQSLRMSDRNFKSASRIISLEMCGNRLWLMIDRKNRAWLK